MCAVGEPHQNWIRECNQGGLIMDGGLFSFTSSLQACASTLLPAQERAGQAVSTQENQKEAEQRWQLHTLGGTPGLEI